MDTSDDFDKMLDFTPQDMVLIVANGSEISQYVDKFMINDFRFRRRPVCYTNCTACNGPEKHQCTSCIKNYALFNNVTPSECRFYNAPCDPKCGSLLSDCLPTRKDYCLQCASNPASPKIALEGSCIDQVPFKSAWNVIEVKHDFFMYYGFDEYFTRIYIRFLGKASGWFGLAFGEDMTNTDMIVVTEGADPTTLKIQDMYSLGKFKSFILNSLNNLTTIDLVAVNTDYLYYSLSLSFIEFNFRSLDSEGGLEIIPQIDLRGKECLWVCELDSSSENEYPRPAQGHDFG